MCYDVSFTTDIALITDFFPDVVFDPQISMEFKQDHIQGTSIFPDMPILYVNRKDDNKTVHLRPMYWSCVEFYQKDMPDMKKRNGMLNIRSERVLDDPKSYWYKIRNRRCLIPLTGTFEHRGITGFKKKVPYFVKPKDQSMFFLPGLYSVAELPDKATGEMLKYWTFGLITRDANPLMRMIHNSGDNPYRMPLYLPLALSKEFLADELPEDRYKELLTYEISSEDLEYFTVDTIRSPKGRSDNKGKHEPFCWTDLPPLGERNPPREK